MTITSTRTFARWIRTSPNRFPVLGQGMKTDSCNTTSIQVPFDPAQFKKMWTMSNPAFMQATKGAASAVDQLQQVQGMPLSESSTINMMGRTMTSTKEATEVKKGPIPASVFEPPAGYTKVESPLKQMQQGRAARPR